jgi:hypothetical protein
MPKTNLRTDKSSLCNVVVEGDRLRLLDVKETEKLSGVHSNYVISENLLQNNILPGENFCYHLEDKDGNYEIGFGEIVKEGRRFYLEREKPLWNGKKSKDGNVDRNRSRAPFSFSGEAPLFLYTLAPNFEDCFAYPNSVLCSSKPLHPSPVEMQDNTLLGCKDGAVQSVDGSEFLEMFGELIVNNLNEKALVLSSIRLKPTNRMLNPVRGTIIYNNDTNRIEFYNGQDWSAL